MSEKICLAIETTGFYLGLSLYSFNGTSSRRRRTFYKESASRQSDALVPEMDRLLRSARVPKSKLDLIAVDIGPGSFTGVRVGVAVARAVAQGLKLPLVGISSLEAMAWQGRGSEPQLCVSLIPALAGEVYMASYEISGDKLRVRQKPEWTTETVFRTRLGEAAQAARSPVRLVAAGKDVAPLLTELPTGVRVERHEPHPDPIAERACAVYAHRTAKQHFSFEAAAPLYLQPSWAERELRARA